MAPNAERRQKRVRAWPRRLAWGVMGAAAMAALCMPAAVRHVRAVGLLLGAIGVEDPLGLIGRAMHPVRAELEQELLLPGGRVLRVRSYRPSGVQRPPGVVLLHGIHHGGIAEARFVRLAHALAGAGHSVLTPELAALSDYRIEPSTIEVIAACIEHHARQTSGPVGAWGISFAGGLLLLAATRPDVQAALAYVVTVGAHHDLGRVARYYAGERTLGPDGAPPAVAPHPYGARVMIHAYVDHFFAPDSLGEARRALRLYVEDRFDAARHAAQRLGGDDRVRLMRFLDGDKAAIAGELIRVASEHEADMATVSPRGQLGALRTPTFLLHGVEDSVIPSLETRYLAREVPAGALRRVLVTPVLGHADLSQKLPWRDYLDLVRLAAEVLRAGEG